jgi:hypothetical protein
VDIAAWLHSLGTQQCEGALRETANGVAPAISGRRAPVQRNTPLSIRQQLSARHEFTFPARLDANNRIDIRGKDRRRP